MQILQRKREVFGKRAIVIHDAQYAAPGAVTNQALPAKFAERTKTQGAAPDIDFAADSFSQPAFPVSRGRIDFDHLPDKFVPRSAAERVIPAEDFDVGIADAGEPDANQCPIGPRRRRRLAAARKFAIADGEGQQETYSSAFSGSE